MFFWELVQQYPYLIIAIVGFAVYFFVARQQAISWLKVEIIKAMLAVEKLAKKEVEMKGEQLMNKVVSYTLVYLLPKLPWWLRLFATEEVVRYLVQKLHDKTKDLLDDGKLNSSC